MSIDWGRERTNENRAAVVTFLAQELGCTIKSHEIFAQGIYFKFFATEQGIKSREQGISAAEQGTEKTGVPEVRSGPSAAARKLDLDLTESAHSSSTAN